uniref:Uncharacterized protein n=1 Tax=Romanomermis culicivorax TaxID=13658 RepID=A0A915ISL6_ROMCU
MAFTIQELHDELTVKTSRVVGNGNNISYTFTEKMQTVLSIIELLLFSLNFEFKHFRVPEFKEFPLRSARKI